eukprot:185996-Pyramimonas_sp.AAC.2
MIRSSIALLISYLSSCLPSELWETLICRRRDPDIRAIRFSPHVQALNLYLLLGSGVGYIFVWLALASGVIYITTNHGTVECPTAPAFSRYTPQCSRTVWQPTVLHLHLRRVATRHAQFKHRCPSAN